MEAATSIWIAALMWRGGRPVPNRFLHVSICTPNFPPDAGNGPGFHAPPRKWDAHLRLITSNGVLHSGYPYWDNEFRRRKNGDLLCWSRLDDCYGFGMGRPGPNGNAAERSVRARIAALAKHASCDGKQATASARAAFLERFAREVDPDGRLEPEERQRRAGIKRREYMTRLALKSAQSRRRKSASRTKTT